MLTQKPRVGLGTGQTGAVNAGLLPGSHTDGLTVHRVADRVGLRVFERDERDDQIPHRALGQMLLLCDDVAEQRAVDAEVVAPLLKGHAKHLLALGLGRHIVRIDAHDVIAPLFLALENFQRLGLIPRGDDAVRHLAGQQLCGGHVAHVRERHPVPERAHAVGAPGSGIGAGQRGVIQFRNVIHKAGLFEAVGKRDADRRGGRADVLEGGRGRETERFLQLLDKLPTVEGVKKIDVSGSAVENFNRQVAPVLHINAGGLLVGIATVFQFKFFHARASFLSCPDGY